MVRRRKVDSKWVTIMGEHTPTDAVEIKVKDEEIIKLDQLKIKALYTPILLFGRSLTKLSSILFPLATSSRDEDLGLAGLVATNSSGRSKSNSLKNMGYSKLGTGRRKISLKIAGVKIESGLTNTSGFLAFPFNL